MNTPTKEVNQTPSLARTLEKWADLMDRNPVVDRRSLFNIAWVWAVACVVNLLLPNLGECGEKKLSNAWKVAQYLFQQNWSEEWRFSNYYKQSWWDFEKFSRLIAPEVLLHFARVLWKKWNNPKALKYVNRAIKAELQRLSKNLNPLFDNARWAALRALSICLNDTECTITEDAWDFWIAVEKYFIKWDRLLVYARWWWNLRANWDDEWDAKTYFAIIEELITDKTRRYLRTYNKQTISNSKWESFITYDNWNFPR